ncbi:MAG: peptide deformylase [Pseudomonadota bacterium]
MARRFLHWPDPALSAVAEPVEAVDAPVRAIWDEMLEVMYAMPGIGLAAPQLGIGLRLAVVDAGSERAALRLANPELISASQDSVAIREASPNLPGVSEEVTRPKSVVIRYLDETGVMVTRELDGLWARSVQHQLDHLDGRLFIDRLSRLRRQRALERWRKVQRKTARKAVRTMGRKAQA